ncbi:MAG: hypothetical protein VYD87_13320 [Pseudomonadota bacterium]|nr:hypothetical protein [Pseudomonadota bacterium]MEE3098753.1 hypothetical protein [Pseudomonadota bacterium]
MGALNGTFFQTQNSSLRGNEFAIPAGKGAIGFAEFTTSDTAGTVQRGGAEWSAPSDGYVLVYGDVAHRVAAGETAATGASPVGHYVPASQYLPISIRAGQTLSAIEA